MNALVLAQQIRNKRKEQKLSAEALAVKINVSKDNIYKWEKGTKPSDPEDYLKLTRWLNGEMEKIPDIPIKSPVESEDSYRADRIKKLEEDQAKYIKKLEEDNEKLWNLVKDNQEIIKTNLSLVLATVRTISVRQIGTSVVALGSLERLEKKAGLSPGSLVKVADKEIVQIEREAYRHGTEVAQDS